MCMIWLIWWQGDRGACEEPGVVWEGEGHAGKDEQALRWEQVLSEYSYNMTCYDVHREFLENMKKRQEKKVNDLLEDNKELIESIKRKVAFFQILHTRLFLFSQESCRYERCDWGSQSRVWRDDGEDGVWSNIERLSFDKVRVSSIVKVWITSDISIE